MANVTTLLKYGLKTNIVKAILFDVLTNASRYYYTFGRSVQWPTVTGTDNLGNTIIVSGEALPPSVIDSYNYELDVRRNSIFLKLIDANDVAIVVDRRSWQSGFVYDMYDEYSSSSPAYSGATSLDQANFYVINSDYDVFKCLYNNRNRPSTVQPFLTGDTITPLKLSDGYIWKYMYSIPLSLRNKFLTSEYMPVLTSLTSSFYSNGAITGFSIVNSGKNLVKFWKIKNFTITNGGSGYTNITVSFPTPSFLLGTQAAVSITLTGGVATGRTLTPGTFYLFQAKPTITTTGGTGFAYSIEYEEDTFSGYSTIEVTGDGQSELNGYSIKSVSVPQRGSFTTKLSGELFNFPSPPRLDDGQKPVLQVNYRPVQNSPLTGGTWSIDSLNPGIITITKTSHGLTNGSNVTLVFTSGAFRPLNDQYTITVLTSSTFTVPNTSGITTNQSGNVSIDDNILFEVDTVTVVNGGYSYDKPLYSAYNSPNTNDVYTVTSTLSIVSGAVLTAAQFDLNVSTQKNQAVLAPVIGTTKELEHVIIQDTGIGYSNVSTEFKSYIRINNDPEEPDAISYVEVQGTDDSAQNGYIAGFVPAVIAANISQGNLDTKQSDVEILAVDGSIEVIKVTNSGNGYSSTDQLRIIGDGVGCTAVPVIENSQIVAVIVTQPGSGYTQATVEIIGDDKLGLNKATFSAIISPKGGHGKDAVQELFARTIAFYTRLSGTEVNQGLLVDNDYRQVSILKNPLKYDIEEYYRNATGSGCVLLSVDKTTENTATYNILTDSSELIVSVGVSNYKFILVHKANNTVENKFKLLLKPIDNYIPSVGQSLNYISNGSNNFISPSAVTPPTFNKFSGEMLYIDNRVAFNPSPEQAVTITTLISF